MALKINLSGLPARVSGLRDMLQGAFFLSYVGEHSAVSEDKATRTTAVCKSLFIDRCLGALTVGGVEGGNRAKGSDSNTRT